MRLWPMRVRDEQPVQPNNVMNLLTTPSALVEIFESGVYKFYKPVRGRGLQNRWFEDFFNTFSVFNSPILKMGKGVKHFWSFSN